MAIERIPHDDLVFDVDVAGPDDGPAVVLLHGFPQDHACWDAVVGNLHDHGLRTIAPDLRGYSPDARPRDPAAYRMVEHVGDVVAMLDHLGVDRAHVVGHDWGGALAWALAQSASDRVDTLTVLSTPHPAAMGEALRTSTQGLKSWYFLVLRSRVAERLVLPRLRGLLMSAGLPRDRAMHAGEMMDRPGAFTGALNWYRGMDQSGVRAGADVTVPTTYAWGVDDAYFARRGALLTSQHVTADYRFVPIDGGHWLPDTHADVVARLVRERLSGPDA